MFLWIGCIYYSLGNFICLICDVCCSYFTPSIKGCRLFAYYRAWTSAFIHSYRWLTDMCWFDSTTLCLIPKLLIVELSNILARFEKLGEPFGFNPTPSCVIASQVVWWVVGGWGKNNALVQQLYIPISNFFHIKFNSFCRLCSMKGNSSMVCS